MRCLRKPSKNIDYVLITNGLGNQMSQYAFYLAKKAEGQDVDYICRNNGHNGIELERLFGIDCRTSFFKKCLIKIRQILSTHLSVPGIKYLRRFFISQGFSFYNEAGNYQPQRQAFEQGRGIRFLHGGWHSETYFHQVAEKVRQTYCFPPFTEERNEIIATEATAPNAVAVHIRGGDYLSAKNFHTFGIVCSPSYYEKAIAEIEKSVSNPCFYVFSNDIALARKIMGQRNAVFVNWNVGKDSWQDMALMSLFSHIIIANSTFSWWAAWLDSRRDKQVLCPALFMNNRQTSDIYPQRWKRIR